MLTSVLTAILTMLSLWLKNLMASVYRGKSLVCWKQERTHPVRFISVGGSATEPETPIRGKK